MEFTIQLPLDASLVSAAPYELVRINNTCMQTCKISDVLLLEISGLHLDFSLDASAVPTNTKPTSLGVLARCLYSAC